MTRTAQRPLLFLDVDGPLIPFGGEPLRYQDGDPIRRTGPGPGEGGSNPLLARINPQHGPRLTALPYELVWATTWMADANEIIAPRIGLSRLAVVVSPTRTSPLSTPGRVRLLPPRRQDPGDMDGRAGSAATVARYAWSERGRCRGRVAQRRPTRGAGTRRTSVLSIWSIMSREGLSVRLASSRASVLSRKGEPMT
ncbi:hypothetical protein [Streptomyces sp. NBC_00872]|uniref:hypothetical protein n=1 Tax=Streptomyces sp. NBC_00872 TaxID=2903686 RepID=UPI00386BC54E